MMADWTKMAAEQEATKTFLGDSVYRAVPGEASGDLGFVAFFN